MSWGLPKEFQRQSGRKVKLTPHFTRSDQLWGLPNQGFFPLRLKRYTSTPPPTFPWRSAETLLVFSYIQLSLQKGVEETHFVCLDVVTAMTSKRTAFWDVTSWSLVSSSTFQTDVLHIQIWKSKFCLLLYLEYGSTFPRKFDVFLPDWMASHSRRVLLISPSLC
jgi:hypothetical protein